MILKVEKLLIDRLKKLEPRTLQKTVAIVWNDNNELVYIGGTLSWLEAYGSSVFNNKIELSSNEMILSLSELINGNDKLHIEVIETL